MVNCESAASVLRKDGLAPLAVAIRVTTMDGFLPHDLVEDEWAEVILENLYFKVFGLWADPPPLNLFP